MQEVMREFKCFHCGHEWKVPFGGGRQMACFKCGSAKIKRTNPGIGGPHRGKGKGFQGDRNRC
jgi:DNA-directed RNA polymerase subunit RPC12/RpoP